MKQLYCILLIFCAVVISCSEKKEIEIEEEVKPPIEEEDKEKEEEELPPEAFVGFYVDCDILFTDSNNVSVFDQSGYGWKVSQIQVRFLVDGKELHPKFYGTLGISTDENYPGWTGVMVGGTLNESMEPEYTTTLLKFPDHSVDTLYCLVKNFLWEWEYNGKLYSSGLYTEKAWYNGELKFDMENRDLNPEVFFDGRERDDRMFHIVK